MRKIKVSFNVLFIDCACNAEGSADGTCENDSGKCNCKDNVVGNKCTECVSEYYGFPDCKGMRWLLYKIIKREVLLNPLFSACMCNPMGSEDNNCNGYTGKCFCKSPTISGDNCDKCVRTYFGFPNCQGNTFPKWELNI